MMKTLKLNSVLKIAEESLRSKIFQHGNWSYAKVTLRERDFPYIGIWGKCVNKEKESRKILVLSESWS
jgi:hypothetical protein